MDFFFKFSSSIDTGLHVDGLLTCLINYLTAQCCRGGSEESVPHYRFIHQLKALVLQGYMDLHTINDMLEVLQHTDKGGRQIFMELSLLVCRYKMWQREVTEVSHGGGLTLISRVCSGRAISPYVHRTDASFTSINSV